MSIFVVSGFTLIATLFQRGKISSYRTDENYLVLNKAPMDKNRGGKKGDYPFSF